MSAAYQKNSYIHVEIKYAVSVVTFHNPIS